MSRPPGSLHSFALQFAPRWFFKLECGIVKIAPADFFVLCRNIRPRSETNTDPVARTQMSGGGQSIIAHTPEINDGLPRLLSALRGSANIDKMQSDDVICVGRATGTWHG